MINSHTKGEYLDQPGFWEIFEAAESLDVPIYIHPRTPAPNILAPYAERGFEMAFHGFQAEVGLHILSIITAGVFDRFPGLKLVIGHLGEGLPYYLYRMDYMQWHTERPGLRGNKEPLKLKRKISDYMKENIYITTSGMPWPPAIKFAIEVLGPDQVLYAMDYPYEIEANEVKMMDDMEISDELKKKIFQTNAEQVFKLQSSI